MCSSKFTMPADHAGSQEIFTVFNMNAHLILFAYTVVHGSGATDTHKYSCKPNVVHFLSSIIVFM